MLVPGPSPYVHAHCPCPASTPACPPPPGPWHLMCGWHGPMPNVVYTHPPPPTIFPGIPPQPPNVWISHLISSHTAGLWVNKTIVPGPIPHAHTHYPCPASWHRASAIGHRQSSAGPSAGPWHLIPFWLGPVPTPVYAHPQPQSIRQPATVWELHRRKWLSKISNRVNNYKIRVHTWGKVSSLRYGCHLSLSQTAYQQN
jgi:hypothetical protein